jgi:ubiquinone/menaquinone biosynthesis C-methylase UbiE
MTVTVPPHAEAPDPDRLNRWRYGLYAPVYDWIAGIFSGQRKVAISALRLQAGQRVLLVGCGTGLDLEFIPAGVAVTGLDLTPGMVRRAEESARRRGLGGVFVVGDARSLPFAPGSFDVVLLHLILAVAPEPERIVAEVDRVLVPGGTVSIFDKFLPVGQTPGLARRLANRVAALAFSELNRTVEPLVAGRGWDVRSDEPAGFRGSYRRIIAIKPVPVSK